MKISNSNFSSFASTRLLVIFTIITLTSSCKHSGSMKSATDKKMQPPSQQLPTASEVFHLRSECAEFGVKIFDKSLIGSALTQSQVSHYNPKTNRCYVELTIQTADYTKRPGIISGYLYDGQTGELLAYTKIEKERGLTEGPSEKDKKTGIAFKKAGLDFEGVCAYIDERMNDEQ